MGRSSGRWVKSLVGLGKSESTQQATEKSSYGGKSGRWNLWKASSKDLGSIWKGGKGSRRRSASEVSDGSSVTGDVTFGVVLAAAAHARPREFKVLRQEWAAIRIQTAFRGFLAKRALRALKAVVRIQALVKGWLVRKQAAVTLKCMQSLVRVQARARAHRVCSSTEAYDLKKMMPGMQRTTSDHLKLAEGGWCNRKGTVEDIRAKSDMKRDGVIRRERALAYSQSQQLKRSNSKRNSSPVSFRSNKDDDSSRQVGWLEKWMASKAWDHRPSGQSCSDISEFYSSKQDEEVDSKPTKFSHPDKKSGRKIDGGSRTPMNSNSKHFQDHSTSSTSDILYAGNSASPSSISTPLSSASFSVQKRTESNNGRLNNGVSAKSLKAKSSSSGSHMTTTERRFFGEKLPCNSSNRKSKIGLCPDHSNNFSTSSQMKLRGPKGKSSNCNKENFQPYKNTPASVIML